MQKTGAEITLIECDSSISYVGKFDYRRSVEIHGRGGTDFQPPIDYYNERKGQFSCLIYFTDGECCPPENAPRDMLWVLSEQSKMNDSLPGKVIRLQL